MISITYPKECCGCGACAQICPKQCISLKEDKEGFLYPTVDNWAEAIATLHLPTFGEQSISVRIWMMTKEYHSYY